MPCGSRPPCPIDPDPRIWLLIGDKLGDNAQARVLADALGWPYEVRQVFPKAEWVLGKPTFVPGPRPSGSGALGAARRRPGPT